MHETGPLKGMTLPAGEAEARAKDEARRAAEAHEPQANEQRAFQFTPELKDQFLIACLLRCGGQLKVEADSLIANGDAYQVLLKRTSATGFTIRLARRQ